jgi:hypothetical protein
VSVLLVGGRLDSNTVCYLWAHGTYPSWAYSVGGGWLVGVY